VKFHVKPNFSDEWPMKTIDHWFAFGWKGAGQPYNPEGYQVTLNPGEFDKATRPIGIPGNP
jgi:hypothetical protein